MLDFFSTTGIDDTPVWVSGNFEDEKFVVDTVFFRNSESRDNLRGVLSEEQLDAFEDDAIKAREAEYEQWQEDRAADLYADRMAA